MSPTSRTRGSDTLSIVRISLVVLGLTLIADRMAPSQGVDLLIRGWPHSGRHGAPCRFSAMVAITAETGLSDGSPWLDKPPSG